MQSHPQSDNPLLQQRDMPRLGSCPSCACLGQFLIHFLFCFCTLQCCCYLIPESIFLIFMCLAILLSPWFACSVVAKVQSVSLVLAANQTREGCMILAFLGLKSRPWCTGSLPLHSPKICVLTFGDNICCKSLLWGIFASSTIVWARDTALTLFLATSRCWTMGRGRSLLKTTLIM